MISNIHLITVMVVLAIFFFSGARIFFNSLESAIFLFSKVSSIPSESAVIPVINSNNSVTVGVELEDGSKIIGQNEISHPSVANHDNMVDKDTYTSLPSKIKRLFYVNQDNQEISPIVNPSVLKTIEDKSAVIVYGMGSLYTSIIPNLVLRGIGEAISTKQTKKLLFLHGSLDRETANMTAVGFIQAITKALNRGNELSHPPSSYITHLFHVETTSIPIEKKGILEMGIQLVSIPPETGNKTEINYDEQKLIQMMLLVARTGSIIMHKQST